MTALRDCIPEEGARRLALGFLDEARAAAERVLEGKDPEGLHDLRVALRRLRTVLRAYKDALRGAISGKRLLRLKELVAATGVGRDLEVQLAWVEGELGASEGSERAGIGGLSARLQDRKEIAYLRLRGATVPALLELAPRLERDLRRYRITYVVGEERQRETFGERAAAKLRAQARELRDAMFEVEGPEHEELAHEARIQAKRLRYLLEPLRDEASGTKSAIKTLKRLQELLGDLNDCSVRTTFLRAELEQVALERARALTRVAEGESDARLAIAGPDETPGLLALVRRCHARKTELWEGILGRWNVPGRDMSALEAEVEAIAAELASRREEPQPAASPPREIERKYLLRALPPEVEGAPSAVLEQGYIPGEQIHERIRKKASDSVTPGASPAERFFRTIKVGTGLSRVELEEETTPHLYAKLWPLTRGKRVRKRRYAVSDEASGLVIEVDAFLDRELFLAEVELPSEDFAFELPAWLAAHVVREVTEEAEFVNLNLAR